MAQSKLSYMNSQARSGMESYLADLELRVKSGVAEADGGRIPLSFDYVISACRYEDKVSEEEGVL